MHLTLTVISYKGVPPPTAASISIGHEHITIGRRKGNSLVLTDPENVVSGKHAEVEYRADGYYITDTSTNGIAINQTEKMLRNGQSAKLKDNDLLTFGEYEVKVSITSQTDRAASQDLSYTEDYGNPNSLLNSNDRLDSASEDPFANIASADEDKEDLMDQNAPDYHDTADLSFLKSISNSDPNKPDKTSTYLDTTDLFADIEPTKEDKEDLLDHKAQNYNDADDFSFLDSFVKSDEMAADNDSANTNTKDPFAEIEPTTEDKNHLLNSHETATTQPRKPEQQPSSTSSTQVELEHIQNFLKGAGIENTSLASNLNAKSFYLIGQLLSCSLQGAIQVLWARSRIKNELGLDVTIVHGRRNNPLKFSPSAQESLIKMLSPIGEAYMPAKEAIDEAFRDIGAHEMAVMAGMRTALHDVLKRFNPERLEQRLQTKSPISVKIPIHKQAMLWDLFQDLYGEIEKEAHDDFNHLFGRAFARAYEDQLRKTKT
jgi:type VI secretion system protein